MKGSVTLTRRQQSIYDYLLSRQEAGDAPPTLDELCDEMGLRSRGSMHAQVKALVDTGLVEAMNGKQRGVRLRAGERAGATGARPPYTVRRTVNAEE